MNHDDERDYLEEQANTAAAILADEQEPDDTPPVVEDFTDHQLLEILNRYHETARANGALEAVASEIAGHGLAEIVDEVRETAAELGIRGDLTAAAYRKLTTAVRNYGNRLAAELAAAKLAPGDVVRLVTSDPSARIGVMVDDGDRPVFVGAVAGGTVGTFRRMHPNEQLSGWALVDVPAGDVMLAAGVTLEALGNPDKFVAPVQSSALEKIQ